MSVPKGKRRESKVEFNSLFYVERKEKPKRDVLINDTIAKEKNYEAYCTYGRRPIRHLT